jgi:hypothetical protein
MAYVSANVPRTDPQNLQVRKMVTNETQVHTTPKMYEMYKNKNQFICYIPWTRSFYKSLEMNLRQVPEC